MTEISTPTPDRRKPHKDEGLSDSCTQTGGERILVSLPLLMYLISLSQTKSFHVCREVQGGYMATVIEYGLPTVHTHCMDCHLSYLTSCGHIRLELSALHISQNKCTGMKNRTHNPHGIPGTPNTIFTS